MTHFADIYPLRLQHGKADRPTVIFEALGDPECKKIVLKFS